MIVRKLLKCSTKMKLLADDTSNSSSRPVYQLNKANAQMRRCFTHLWSKKLNQLVSSKCLNEKMLYTSMVQGTKPACIKQMPI